MFSEHYKESEILSQWESIHTISSEQVERCLKKSKWGMQDLPVLISESAQKHLEAMAQIAQHISIQRFGKSMRLFVPLYLSNECYNRCTYCGFSMDLDIQRKTLTVEESIKEAMTLKERGFKHLLLLTGEAPDHCPIEYFEEITQKLRPHFASIGFEIQPLKTHEYERLVAAGADSIAVYQESYHGDTYKKVHLSGKKRMFDHRLDALDRAAEAGFIRLHVGALLGLYDWRFEALAVGQHIAYLDKKYWQSKLSVSVPRIKNMAGEFQVNYPVSDASFLQYILAMRMVFPDLGISLSTRESPALRDALIPLGITDMSADSKTNPGGYTQCDSASQFDTSDGRSLQQIQQLLLDKGYDPATKDWDPSFHMAMS